MIFGQTFDPQDIGTVGALFLMEGALSIDNALVLAIVSGRSPEGKQIQALRYGLAISFAFRLIAVLVASYLLRWPVVKLFGGGYLIYLAGRHFFVKNKKPLHKARSPGRDFWSAVLAIELTDMVFAVDNILAAVALVGPPPAGWPAGALHPKLWVIMTGGMLGVILARFAAGTMAVALRKFPRFQMGALLIVLLVGARLVIEWARPGVDFQNPNQLAFWVFWLLLAGCLGLGFLPRKSVATS
jgi:YkoY family integral membrane protein